MMRLQEFFVDSRLCVEALCPRLTDHRDQVSVARLIFAKQHQMIPLRIQAAGLIEAAARRDIALAADDRLDAGFLRRLIEFDRTKHRPVVGDRHGAHAFLLDVVHQPGDPARAVKQAVFGMQVQVGERHRRLRTYCFSFFSYAANRSGRRSAVRCSDCAARQASMFAWCPDSRTSGTALPRHSGGRVYWGYSSRPEK